jgi:Cd2+/Zn2+-exporting ATPase
VLSRRARSIVRQNITISLGVIFFLIISALAEKINLTAGVIGHEGSTVLVILNGLLSLRAQGASS